MLFESDDHFRQEFWNRRKRRRRKKRRRFSFTEPIPEEAANRMIAYFKGE